MQDLAAEVKKAADAGKCIDTAMREVKLPKYATLTNYENWLPLNVERYCLYSAFENTLYRARIFHQPWPLRDVSLANYTTSLFEPLGLRVEQDKAKLLAGGPVEAEIWPVEEVAIF